MELESDIIQGTIDINLVNMEKDKESKKGLDFQQNKFQKSENSFI